MKWLKCLQKYGLFGKTRRGQGSSCVWDWSRVVLGWAEWALIGQICITVWEQCPLMAIHSDCWHWDWWFVSNMTPLFRLVVLFLLALIMNYWGSKCRCAFTCCSKLVLAKHYLQSFIAVLSSVLTRQGFFKASMKFNPFCFHNLMHFQVKHNSNRKNVGRELILSIGNWLNWKLLHVVNHLHSIWPGTCFKKAKSIYFLSFYFDFATSVCHFRTSLLVFKLGHLFLSNYSDTCCFPVLDYF